MGGHGSGRSNGRGMLTNKCHEYHSIDLAWLKRKNCLRTGCAGNLKWSRCGQPTGNIDYRVEPGGLRLIYRTRSFGGDWRDVDELIPFNWSNTNFRGRRPWFLCPSCRRACRILYGGSYFRCRKCHRLKYESQYEPAFGRAANRAHKLREKLGYLGSLDDPLPAKPKGMHWKSYRRLQAKDAALQDRWALGVMGWMRRLK